MRPLCYWGPLSIAALLGAQLFLAAPAQAFDCAKASTRVERAICADPQLKAADDAMAASYSALMKRLDGADAKTMRRSQIGWVKQREEQCGYVEGSAVNDCILTQTEARSRFLAAAPQSGPGPGAPMVPVARRQEGGPQLYDIEITAVKFAEPDSPGQKLFNAKVDAAMAEAPYGRDEDFDPNRPLSFELDIGMTYASPRLVSATAFVFRYDGGAHPNTNSSVINIDLRKGAALQFDALFRAGARDALSQSCRDKLLEQKREKFNGDFDVEQDIATYADSIAGHVADMSRWAFYADKALVRFDPYQVGSYAEGAYDCSFSYDELRPHTKDTSILPD